MARFGIDRAAAYEDSAGTIYVVQYDRDGDIRWACRHEGGTDDAIAESVGDFVALAVQGQDPIGSGWDSELDALHDGFEMGPERWESDLDGCDTLADTDWYQGRDSDMWADWHDWGGGAGRKFLRELAEG